ncbi:MAG: SsrA-binding protein SmpB [Candidatus Gastranaerophilales bacterium]|nr:SsrA-binding protein SmpB [Candidatus Gastranaerophilales bacterium]
MSNEKIISLNRKAYHEYTILEVYQAGIVLTGTEIKSVRNGQVNIKDSYASIEKGEVWLCNAHISPYEMGNIYNHEPLRKRKLLLTKQEINKLIGKLKESGLTIVPLKIYLDKGWAKIEIGIAKGKKLHDKRESIAKKSVKREIEREIKNRY